MQGLRAGALGEEIEARLRGVTEPSVEKLREALREEIEKLEERFNVRRGRDGAGGRSEDLARIETGEDPGGTRSRQRPQMGEDRKAEEASTCPTGTTH